MLGSLPHPHSVGESNRLWIPRGDFILPLGLHEEEVDVLDLYLPWEGVLTTPAGSTLVRT